MARALATTFGWVMANTSVLVFCVANLSSSAYFFTVTNETGKWDSHRHMHLIKPKGSNMGLGFQFFEYLGFGFGFSYFANLLQISN